MTSPSLSGTSHNPAARVRTKIKVAADLIQALLKIMAHEDAMEVVHACACIANLSEDLELRADFIRTGMVAALLQVLGRPDARVQAASAITLARLLQDPEAQGMLAKQPGHPSIARLIELLASRDVHVCRNAAYALANAIQNGGGREGCLVV